MAEPCAGEGQLIVCFGDAKRGQLGVEPTAGARHGETVLLAAEFEHDLHGVKSKKQPRAL